MTVKEIIQIENGNRNTIILLREGISGVPMRSRRMPSPCRYIPISLPANG